MVRVPFLLFNPFGHTLKRSLCFGKGLNERTELGFDEVSAVTDRLGEMIRVFFLLFQPFSYTFELGLCFGRGLNERTELGFDGTPTLEIAAHEVAHTLMGHEGGDAGEECEADADARSRRREREASPSGVVRKKAATTSITVLGAS